MTPENIALALLCGAFWALRLRCRDLEKRVDRLAERLADEIETAAEITTDTDDRLERLEKGRTTYIGRN